jgi:hypothetical protein
MVVLVGLVWCVDSVVAHKYLKNAIPLLVLGASRKASI